MMALERERHRYDTFDILKKATELKKVQDDACGLVYHKMVQTGALDFHDYGVGFLNFELSAWPCERNKGAFPDGGPAWYIRLWIATIDDGDLGAWGVAMSERKARGIVTNIANEVMEALTVFPTRDELNKQLQPFGMFVTHE